MVNGKCYTRSFPVHSIQPENKESALFSKKVHQKSLYYSKHNLMSLPLPGLSLAMKQ